MQKGKRNGEVINRSPGDLGGEPKGPFLEADSAAVLPQTDPSCREAAAPGRGRNRGKKGEGSSF